MSPKREVVDVRMHERILWIGSKAYPIPHIAMVELSTWRLSWPPVLRSYGKAVLLYAVALVLATMLSDSILFRMESLPKLVLFVIAIHFVVKTFKLLEILTAGPYQVLLLRTTGASIEAIISPDQHHLTKIAQDIVDGINNPQATFTYKIKKLVSNTFNQSGLLNIGAQEIN